MHFIPWDIAETVAQTCLITRDEQDEFALQSQLKCTHAMSLGHFDAEIEPIVISTSKSMSVTRFLKENICGDWDLKPSTTGFYSVGDVQIKKDEYPRQGVTLESLSKLRTAFKEGEIFTSMKMTVCSCMFLYLAGTVTAGNASGLLRVSLHTVY